MSRHCSRCWSWGHLATGKVTPGPLRKELAHHAYGLIGSKLDQTRTSNAQHLSAIQTLFKPCRNAKAYAAIDWDSTWFHGSHRSCRIGGYFQTGVFLSLQMCRSCVKDKADNWLIIITYRHALSMRIYQGWISIPIDRNTRGNRCDGNQRLSMVRVCETHEWIAAIIMLVGVTTVSIIYR